MESVHCQMCVKGTQLAGAHGYKVPSLSWFAYHKICAWNRKWEEHSLDYVNKPCGVKVIAIQNYYQLPWVRPQHDLLSATQKREWLSQV